MKYKNISLNIGINFSKEEWAKVPLIYEKMPGWLGFREHGENKNIPYWFSFDENEKHLFASNEISGLFIGGCMDEKEWIEWIEAFIKNATEILGFKVKDMEE